MLTFPPKLASNVWHIMACMYLQAIQTRMLSYFHRLKSFYRYLRNTCGEHLIWLIYLNFSRNNNRSIYTNIYISTTATLKEAGFFLQTSTNVAQYVRRFTCKLVVFEYCLCLMNCFVLNLKSSNDLSMLRSWIEESRMCRYQSRLYIIMC